MPNTPRNSPQICTHERGVGTTVCLHCRKEARIVARDRRTRLMLRGAAGAIVVATGLAATALGATAIREKKAAKRVASTSSAPVRDTVANAPLIANAPAPAASQPVASQPVASTLPAPTKPAPTPPSAPRASAPSPIVPTGPSALHDGVTATRTDTAVMVAFDLPLVRTRRGEKFEQLVRATLPQIYGHGVDAILTSLPEGSLAKQGDLLTELPARGMRIPLDNAWEIRVFPETRKGQDGPLVVRYRVATVAR